MGEEKKRDPSTGSSTGPVYQVQVRVRDGWPGFALGEMVIDQNWQDLRLAPSIWPVGVPARRSDMDNVEYGVSFHIAEAQRWIFICLVHANRGFDFIETRIVERRITRTWKCEDIGEVTAFPAWQEPHNIWGKPTVTLAGADHG